MKIDKHSLFEDSEDEKKLNQLPETEKEKILYERHLKLQKLKEKKEMDQKFKEIKSLPEKQELKQETKKKIENFENFTYDEFNSILLKRNELVNNIYRPCFNECVGKFIRIRFETVYAIREILSIEEGKIYEIMNNQGRKAKTNKYIKVKKGTNTTENMSLNQISNSNLEHIEFDYFKRKIPNFPIKKIKIKTEKFRELLNKKIDSFEKNKINEERQRHNEMPYQRIWEKVKLIKQQEEAFKKGDKITYVKLHNQITKMDEEEIDPEEEKERVIWEKINQKNKQIDFERGMIRKKSGSPEYSSSKRQRG
ncbi:Paf1/RNA polymerase II complex, RTF1 component (involved in regulation of TATA box-binding protein) [Pseudoloma neurophilia]|uniref:Paf1/RNA polymerase II complex, RTF1 component (Involved in regulation of TATA box-binding protein) n=1 Tax=Pseudoloma neurophilia TaxID=146866 RepID=A0A0R0M097_9MICR|nr:Paf1/RNA polymerase II complex, RTF1 component (involved in regulation of TATA box-binding protein) [Pseudoloma neurophilia]